jgi:nucleotide-binding universal stress UspA family protein
MILMNAILVATDFGETSDGALVYGRNLARTFGARLYVLHVAEDVSATAGQDLFAGDIHELQADMVEAATTRLYSSLSDNDLTTLRAKPVVRVSSNPANAIIGYAKEVHVDIIVVGTHGRGPMSHLLMGSVAEHVVRHAPCPVLVVRPNEHEFVVPDPVGVHTRI